MDSTDILKMIENGELRESEHLEFKEIYFYEGKLKNHNYADKLIEEICAFANKHGGYIIIGVQEDESKNPKNIVDCGLTEDELEMFEQSIRNKLGSKVTPNINGIDLHIINIDDKNLLEIYIPSSPIKPHACNNGEDNFYIREGNKKRRMKYEDLRRIFRGLEEGQIKIKQFIDHRINQILEGVIDDSMIDQSSLIIHIIPEESLEESNFVDVREYDKSYELNVMIGNFSNSYYNSDGFLRVNSEYTGEFRSYIQAFHNGSIEAGEVYSLNNDLLGEDNVMTQWDKIESSLIKYIYKCCNIINEIHGSTSFYINISLLNMKNKHSKSFNLGNDAHPIRNNLIKLPIIKWSINDSYPNAMHPLMLQFAHTFNSRYSSLYDSNGNPYTDKFIFLN